MPSLQNKIFFGMIHYILSEQKNVPWIIKTSLINITGLSDEVSNNLYQKESKIDDILAYVTDAKPFRTKFDQFLEKFNSSKDSMSIQGDRQYIDADNYIVIPNKIEKNNIEITMRFDAVSSDPSFPEFKVNYKYYPGDIVRYKTAIYKAMIEHISEEGEIEEDISKSYEDRRFVEINGKLESNSALWDIDAASRICALKTTDLGEIHEILHTNFKALNIDGGALDLNKFGYDVYDYDEINYDSPSVSNIYCLVQLTEDCPYPYTKEFVKVGTSEFAIETSDQYTLTGNDILIKATYQGRTRYIQDYYMTLTGMITLYDGIRKEEKIDILVTPKDSEGNVMEEYVKEYFWVGYDFMVQSSIDFENAYKDISTRSFPIPSSQFVTKNVKIYITTPEGDTFQTQDFIYDANSAGKSITITNPELLTEFTRVMISVCDYSYIYDKTYSYADVYGVTNNIHIIDGNGFLRPHYDANHPSELIYSKGVDTISVSKISDNAGLDGGPYINYQIYDSAPKQYYLNIIPQSKDAVIPFNNGLYSATSYVDTNTSVSVYPLVFPNSVGGYCSSIAFANGGTKILYEEQDFYTGEKIKIDIVDYSGTLKKSQIKVYLNGDDYTDFSIRNNTITLNNVDVGTWYRITVFEDDNYTIVSKKSVVENDIVNGSSIMDAYYTNIFFAEDGKIANYPYMEYIPYNPGQSAYTTRIDTNNKTIHVYSYNGKTEKIDEISHLNWSFTNNTLNLQDWNNTIYYSYIFVVAIGEATFSIDSSYKIINPISTLTCFNLSNNHTNLIIDKFTCNKEFAELPEIYYNLFVWVDNQLANLGTDYRIEGKQIIFNDAIGKDVVFMYTNVENNPTPTNIISLQQIDMFGNHKIASLDTSKKIYLTRDLKLGDNIIYLNNIDNITKPIISDGASVPGTIIVNSEIIEFWKFDDLHNTVSQIRRGRFGTGIQKIHVANSEVIDFNENATQNITPTIQTAKYIVNADDKNEELNGYDIPGEVLSPDAINVFMLQRINLLSDITTTSSTAMIDSDNVVKPGNIELKLPYTEFISPDTKDKLAITLSDSYKMVIQMKNNMTVIDVIDLIKSKIKNKFGFNIRNSKGEMIFSTEGGAPILLENEEGQPLQKITGSVCKGTVISPTVTMNGQNGIKINGNEVIWGAFHYSIAEMSVNPMEGQLSDILMSLLSNSYLTKIVKVSQSNNKVVLIPLKNQDIDIEPIGTEDCLERLGMKEHYSAFTTISYNEDYGNIQVFNNVPSSIGSIWVDGDKLNFTKLTEIVAPIRSYDGDIEKMPSTKGKFQLSGLNAIKDYKKNKSYAIASYGYKLNLEADYLIKGNKVVFNKPRSTGEVILIVNTKK